MTEVVERVIDALNSRLRDAPLSPSLPIAWEGLSFAPGSDPYLQPTLLPARTNTLSLASQTRQLSGLYQVSVFWPVTPVTDRGVLPAVRVADALAAWYCVGTCLNSDGTVVKIIQAPYVSRVVQESAWLSVPLTIPWTTIVV